MTYLGKVDADTLDLTKPENRQVYLCCVVNLPFRLRLGDSYAFPESNNKDFKLYFRNPYKVPDKGVQTTDLETEASKQGTYNFFLTKVLIVLKKQLNPSRALAVLNDFIIAYSTLYKSTSIFMLTGQVKTLTNMQFSEAAESEIQYHCPKGYVLTDSDVEKLINWKPPLLVGSVSTFPLFKFKDLTAQAMDKIPVAFDRHRNYVFYEFAFYAKVRLESEDYLGAVLMSCIALEAVHSAFLRSVLEEALSAYKLKEKFIDALLQAPRLYERIKMTASVFMDNNERPPNELLGRCKKAIQIRNDIMHAKYSEGTYKLRKYQTLELLDAYNVFEETYDYFKEALEKRQDQNYS